ncbi:MAG: hypothetical protein ACYC64_13855 [Armatimonadota bacterium]
MPKHILHLGQDFRILTLPFTPDFRIRQAEVSGFGNPVRLCGGDSEIATEIAEAVFSYL